MVQRRTRRKLTAPDARARPRRCCRIPVALSDMIVDAPKRKKLEHIKISKKRIDTSRSDEDSGYEEIDRSSFSSSPNSSIGEDMPSPEAIMDDSLENQTGSRCNWESSPNYATFNPSPKKKANVRPVFVSDADESDSDSCDAGSHIDAKYRCQNRKISQNMKEPEQEVEMISQMQSGKRMLMKDWILHHLERRSFPGLRWFDEKNGLCQISWKHRSAGAWCRDDVKLFECWADYTGRHESDRDFKRWKANFRCALNILPDMEEITQLRNPKGKNPYKVYKFLDKETRARKRIKSCSSVCKPRKRRNTMTPECSIEEASITEAQLAVEQIQPHSTDTNTVQSIGLDSEVSQMYDGSTFLMTPGADDCSSPAWSPPSETIVTNVSLASTIEKSDVGLTSSSKQMLPSVATLFRRSDSNCLSDSLQDFTACEPSLWDTFQFSDEPYDNFLMPAPCEALTSQDCDLLTLNSCILSDDSQGVIDITELQTFNSVMEVSTPLSNLSTIPLTVEEMNSE